MGMSHSQLWWLLAILFNLFVLCSGVASQTPQMEWPLAHLKGMHISEDLITC